MTQDYTECEFYDGICWCQQYKIPVGEKKMQKGDGLIKCQNKTNCHFKQNKKTEHQLKLVNQDNDALSRYCDKLEKIIEEQRNKIAQLTNMQDKKVILE